MTKTLRILSHRLLRFAFFSEPELKILAFVLLIGAGVGVARAHSASLLITHFNTIWTLPCLLVAELLYVPLIRIPKKTQSFAWVSIKLGLLVSFVMGSCYFLPFYQTSILIFFIGAHLMRSYLRWILLELLFLSTEKGRAIALSYSLSLFFELGSLLAVALMIVVPLSPDRSLLIVPLYWISILLFMRHEFKQTDRYELKLASEVFPGESWEEPVKKNVFNSYVLFATTVGMFYALQEYLWRTLLQAQNLDGSSYVRLMSFYVMGANVLGILGAWFAGNATQRSRISPAKIMNAFFIASGLSLILLNLIPTSGTAILFGVICSGGFRSAFGSANQTLMSCFEDESRIKFRTLTQLCFFIVPTVPIFFLSFYTSKSFVEPVLINLSLIVLTLLIACSIFLKSYVQSLSDLMFVYINSLDRVRRVTGTMLLSYIRPRGFDHWFEDVLRQPTKTLIVKTMIEALSFYPSKKSYNIIMSQLDHEKEEIRLSVCEALARLKKPHAWASLVRISLTDQVPYRVRQRAGQILVKEFGVSAVIFYLNELHRGEGNLRCLALHVLSQIGKSDLIVEFLNALEAADSQLIEPSLRGLYQFSEARNYFDKRINHMILKGDEVEFDIACNVISAVTDRKWVKTLRLQSHLSERQQVSLFFCLQQLGESLLDPQIKFLAERFQSETSQNDSIERLVRLSRHARFQLLELWYRSGCFPDGSNELMSCLKRSNLDFHEEILYLRSLSNKFIP